jgi:hypothetical protein
MVLEVLLLLLLLATFLLYAGKLLCRAQARRHRHVAGVRPLEQRSPLAAPAVEAVPPSVESDQCRCVLCRSEVELDDVALPGPQGRCICLRCYLREAGAPSPMSITLQRELALCLRAADQTGE